MLYAIGMLKKFYIDYVLLEYCKLYFTTYKVINLLIENLTD
jgi:hypothetical protein